MIELVLLSGQWTENSTLGSVRSGNRDIKLVVLRDYVGNTTLVGEYLESPQGHSVTLLIWYMADIYPTIFFFRGLSERISLEGLQDNC